MVTDFRYSISEEVNKKEKNMPKMKTHRAAAKRYKVTASGKILRRQAGKKHLLAHKDVNTKRRLSGMVQVADTQLDLVVKELPYLKYSR